jgi:hypothetical protein
MPVHEAAVRSPVPVRLWPADGKLFWTEEDRVNLLALLLENVGADRAGRLGDPSVWMEALEGLRADAQGGGGTSDGPESD